MTGNIYAYAMMKIKIQRVLHSDTQMFAQEEFYQAKPDVVEASMTHISLKSVIEEMGIAISFRIQERNETSSLHKYVRSHAAE